MSDDPTLQPIAKIEPYGATVRLDWVSVHAAHNAKAGELCSLTAAQAKIAALEAECDRSEMLRRDALTLAETSGALALEAELHEQARQNGMGSEREARLMARVAELEKVCRLIDAHYSGSLDHRPAYVKLARAAIDSASSAAGEAP